MNRTLFITIGVAVIFIALVDCHYPYRKIRKLEKKLRNLTSDVEDLKKDVAWMKDILEGRDETHCKNVSKVENVTEVENATKVENVTGEIETKTETVDLHGPVKIKEIIREPGGGGRKKYIVNFEVAHDAPLANFHSYWNYYDPTDYTYKPLNLHITEPKPDPATPITTASVEAYTVVGTNLLFVFGWERVWYLLRLNNSLGTDVNMTGPELPGLYIQPKEVVYEPTSNDFVQFQTLTSLDVKLPFDVSVSEQFITQLGSDHFIDMPPEGAVEFEPIGTKPYRVSNLTLDVTTQMSGVVTMSVKKKFNNSILEEADMNRRFVIRPSNQSGPFRDDLFAFYTGRNFVGAEGNLHQDCRMDARCSVPCTAVGSKVTRTAFRVEGNPQTQSTKTTTSQFFIAEDIFEFDSTKFFSKSHRVRVYCNATNDKGRSILQTTFMNMVKPATVPSAMSKLRGSNSNYREFTVTCVGTGVPTPYMTIIVDCNQGRLAFSGSDLEVVTNNTEGNYIKVRKSVMVPYSAYVETVNGTCTAQNGAGFAEAKTPSRKIYW